MGPIFLLVTIILSTSPVIFTPQLLTLLQVVHTGSFVNPLTPMLELCIFYAVYTSFTKDEPHLSTLHFLWLLETKHSGWLVLVHALVLAVRLEL